MIKLKFRNVQGEGKASQSSCCGSVNNKTGMENSQLQKSCCPEPGKEIPSWAIGSLMTPCGTVLQVSTGLSRADHLEHFRCRTTAYRNNYTIKPGLYAAGNPDKNSDVLVSANYKLSFDMLRRELNELNVWILVLDTKGINVWCAAGKGTFGTDELNDRIRTTRLGEIVAHRRVILPQLGAPGISAFGVKAVTGFQVLFGPVLAKDTSAYIANGYRATKEMRRITFPLWDRIVLTPMEIIPALKKFPGYALLILIIFGLSPSGIFFREAFAGGLPFLLMGFIAIISGSFLTPALLPFIPFRSFALKGWLMGLLLTFLYATLLPAMNGQGLLVTAAGYLFFPLVSSYLGLLFTGSTTYTGMTGVKKELKMAIPVYIGGAALSVVILLIYKISEWGII
jgi:hypothetical protein